MNTIEEEIEDARKQMNEAIQKNDGWLTHWHGSYMMRFMQINADSERRQADFKRRMEEIKEECELRTQLRIDAIMFTRKKTFFEKLFCL